MQRLKGFTEAQKRLLATDRDVEKATEPLSMDANKYTRGSVLVVGGSGDYRGAPFLAAFAANSAIGALRTGAGYVIIAAPRAVVEAAASLSKVYVLRELSGDPSTDMAMLRSVRHDCAVIGPGMEHSRRKGAFAKKVIAMEIGLGNPVVVDAAPIGLAGAHIPVSYGKAVLTPHYGEFKAIAGIDLSGKGTAQKVSVAKGFAGRHHCTLVLKGHVTVVTDGSRVRLVAAKSPALATMGTGDVLDGIIAGYLARHGDAFECAVAGAYVHAKIGDALYRKLGAHITAEDVIGAIPDALKGFDVIS